MAAQLDDWIELLPHQQVLAREIASASTRPHPSRIMAIMPPQSGLSLLMVWSLFWWLARNPTHRVILATFSTSVARMRGRHLRTLIARHGAAHGLALADPLASTSGVRLASGGSVELAGVGATLASAPADLAIIDSPVRSRVDADSAALQRLIWAWTTTELMPRLTRSAPLVVGMPRWSRDDLCGSLLQAEGNAAAGGQWNALYMPAIAVRPEQSGLLDALGREDGEPLPRATLARSDRAALLSYWSEVRQQVGRRDWWSNFQGMPRD